MASNRKAARRAARDARKGVQTNESFVTNNQTFVDRRDYLPPGNWGFMAAMLGGIDLSNRPSDRDDGANRPFIESEVDAGYARGIARWVTGANCPGVGIKENLENYVVGTGFTFQAATKKGQKSPDGLTDAVQDWMDEFLDCNDFLGDLDREIYFRNERDGEQICGLHPYTNGQCKLRLIEPEFIIDPAGEPFSPQELAEYHRVYCKYATSWSFGVHTDEHDVQNVHGYYIRWPDGSQEYRPAKWVVHSKFNVDRNQKRGLSSFYPAWTWLQGQEKLLRNTSEGATKLAAISYIVQFLTASQEQARSMREAQADATYTNANGQTTYQRGYNGSNVLSVPGGQEYKEGPHGAERGNAFLLVVQGLLRQVATRFCMTEGMVSGDDSNNNMASSVEAGSRFYKFAEARQFKAKKIYLRIIWAALEHAFTCGVFRRFNLDWPTFRALVEIIAEAPDIEARDPAAQTERRAKLSEAGVLSKKTWTAQEGLEFEQEQANIAEEPKPEPPGGMPGMGPESGPPGQGGPTGGGGPGGEPPAPAPGDQPSGEYAGITRQQWQRNRKAINDVLQELAQGKMRPPAALAWLTTLGLAPERAKALVDDASDGQLSQAIESAAWEVRVPDTFQGFSVAEAWDESKHPRADDGKFISKGEISAAKHDPKLAAALKNKVTDPKEAKKLDAALADPNDPEDPPQTKAGTGWSPEVLAAKKKAGADVIAAAKKHLEDGGTVPVAGAYKTTHLGHPDLLKVGSDGEPMAYVGKEWVHLDDNSLDHWGQKLGVPGPSSVTDSEHGKGHTFVPKAEVPTAVMTKTGNVFDIQGATIAPDGTKTYHGNGKAIPASDVTQELHGDKWEQVNGTPKGISTKTETPAQGPAKPAQGPAKPAQGDKKGGGLKTPEGLQPGDPATGYLGKTKTVDTSKWKPNSNSMLAAKKIAILEHMAETGDVEGLQGFQMPEKFKGYHVYVDQVHKEALAKVQGGIQKTEAPAGDTLPLPSQADVSKATGIGPFVAGAPPAGQTPAFIKYDLGEGEKTVKVLGTQPSPTGGTPFYKVEQPSGQTGLIHGGDVVGHAMPAGQEKVSGGSGGLSTPKVGGTVADGTVTDPEGKSYKIGIGGEAEVHTGPASHIKTESGHFITVDKVHYNELGQFEYLTGTNGKQYYASDIDKVGFGGKAAKDATGEALDELTNHHLQQKVSKLKAGKAAVAGPPDATPKAPKAKSAPYVPHAATAPKPTVTIGKDWKTVGGKLGSNQAAQMQAPDGTKYYVKHSKTDDHARVESMASSLYELAGAKTLQPQLATLPDGKVATATKWQDVGKFNPTALISDREAAQKNFAVHAWLANWDAVGATNDNQGWVTLPDGAKRMATLDTGGTLWYRAQGGHKTFTNDVGEWETMRNSAYPAGKVFGSMTPEQLKDSAKALQGIKRADVEAIVANSYKEPSKAKQTVDTLMARRDNILQKAGLIPSAKATGAVSKAGSQAKAATAKLKAPKVGQKVGYYIVTKSPGNIPDPPAVKSQPGDFKSHTAKLSDPANAKAKDAFRYYTTSQGAGALNHDLRHSAVPSESTKANLRHVKKFMDAADPLPAGMYSDRFMDFSPQHISEMIAAEGKVIRENAFSSSKVKGTWSGNVQMKIRAAPGAKAVYVNDISAHPTEFELLYPPGQRYYVQKVTKTATGGLEVEAIALPYQPQQIGNLINAKPGE